MTAVRESQHPHGERKAHRVRAVSWHGGRHAAMMKRANHDCAPGASIARFRSREAIFNSPQVCRSLVRTPAQAPPSRRAVSVFREQQTSTYAQNCSGLPRTPGFMVGCATYLGTSAETGAGGIVGGSGVSHLRSVTRPHGCAPQGSRKLGCRRRAAPRPRTRDWLGARYSCARTWASKARAAISDARRVSYRRRPGVHTPITAAAPLEANAMLAVHTSLNRSPAANQVPNQGVYALPPSQSQAGMKRTAVYPDLRPETVCPHAIPPGPARARASQ